MTKPKNKTFEYVSLKKYDGMMGRCYRKNDHSYKRYGERGIKVAAAWLQDIMSFRSWLANYLVQNNIDMIDFITNSNKYQLDRIDSNGHYTPENCRLSTPQQNIRNRDATGVKLYESAEGLIVDGVTGEIIEEECQVFILPKE